MLDADGTTRALLERAYERFNARDIDAVLALMTIDVEWPNGWEGGYVHGHDEVLDLWPGHPETIPADVRAAYLSTPAAARCPRSWPTTAPPRSSTSSTIRPTATPAGSCRCRSRCSSRTGAQRSASTRRPAGVAGPRTCTTGPSATATSWPRRRPPRSPRRCATSWHVAERPSHWRVLRQLGVSRRHRHHHPHRHDRCRQSPGRERPVAQIQLQKPYLLSPRNGLAARPLPQHLLPALRNL